MNHKEQVVITGIGLVSPLGRSPAMIANKLLRGESGITKFSFRKDSPEFTVARVSSPMRQVGPRRWPVGRSTALGLMATSSVVDCNVANPTANPELGIIHATVRGNFQSLLTYQAEIRQFGLDRASPMQFPNTILHATASFLSLITGAAAFNLTVTNGSASGLDSLELARQMIVAGCARQVLCVTSEDISADVMSLLQAQDELDWDFPDPFGHKRAGYVPGEAAVAIRIESESSALSLGRRIFAFCRGYSASCSSQQVKQGDCTRVFERALDDAQISPKQVGCVMANANGSKNDGEEANAISQLFGSQVPVTSLKGALGECGASSAFLSIAAILACAKKRVCPPTLGRSKYDSHLQPIKLLRKPAEIEQPFVVINSFDKNFATACQVLELPQAKGRA